MVMACRYAGLRVTRPRLTLYRFLVQRHDHPGIEQIFADAQASLPSLSLNTVYRTIRTFETAGLVACVTTWRGVARYDADVNSHAHFLCVRCGMIADVDADEVLRFEKSSIRPAHGVIDRADLLLRGVCKGCLAGQQDTG